MVDGRLGVVAGTVAAAGAAAEVLPLLPHPVVHPVEVAEEGAHDGHVI